MNEADYTLMQKVAAGDEHAARELFRRFDPLIRRMISGRAPKGYEDDTAQNIRVRLWRTASRYDPARSSLVTWVMLLTRREICDVARHVTRVRKWDARTCPRKSHSPGPHLPLDEAAVRQILCKMDDLDTVISGLRCRGGLSLHRIAAILGVPPGTVKTRIDRGVRRALSAINGRG